ncbi:MAG: hypothetical protein AAF265_15360 [Pseudomonadota bacterium]
MNRSARTNKTIVRYSLEAALIVFSVLLALFLDSELEARKDARVIAELTGHIEDEMRRNLAIVDEWLPYHGAVLAEIDRYLGSESMLQSLLTDNGIDYGRLMERGLIQDFYSDSSWQLASRSEITSQIEFNLLYSISQAYLSQQNVNNTLVRCSDHFFDRDTQNPDQLVVSLRMLRSLLQELVGQQTVLQSQYREALFALEEP